MLRSPLPQLSLLLLCCTSLSLAVPVQPPASALQPPSTTITNAAFVLRRQNYSLHVIHEESFYLGDHRFLQTDHFTVARNVRYVLHVVSPSVDIVGFRFWYNANGEHAEDEIWDAAAGEPPSLRPGSALTLRSQVIAIDIPDETWAELGNVLVEAYVEISFAQPGARGEVYLTQERTQRDGWYAAG